eukprot:c14812_g1_i1 orf=119-496(+)
MASPVVVGRVVFVALGCLSLLTVLYTCIAHGSPFRKDLLTPWMNATLIDFYVNVAAISAWVCYKESFRICTFIWIALLICFGSITTCLYISVQLFKLSPHDPIYLILLKDRHFSDTSVKVAPYGY